MARPFVYINMAMTADGKITSARREYPRLTSDLDRLTMDRLRAEADALVVGAGTLRADDPPLRVRDPAMQAYRESLGKPAGRPPLRCGASSWSARCRRGRLTRSRVPARSSCAA